MKTLVVALAALALALGLVACGGDEDSGSTASETSAGAGAQTQSDGSDSGGGAGGGSGKQAGSGGGDDKSGGSGGGADDFTSKPHDDSGGGSQQFRVKGGDNSVQEFGEEAGEEEFEAAAVTLHDFLDARAEGNWAAACTYMSESIVESFEKLAAQAKEVDASNCGQILEQLTNPAAKKAMKAEAARANVGSLRTEGDRSFVIYTGTGGTILAMPMSREGGDWKVASLAGTPLN